MTVRVGLRVAKTVVLAVMMATNLARAQAEDSEKTYQDLLHEKVGEVAEIRYGEIAATGSGEKDGDKALMRLALYRFFKKDYAGAEYHLRNLLKQYPASPLTGEARLWLGRTHLSRGEATASLLELQGGLKELNAAGTAGGDLAGRYLFWIGEAYLRDGKSTDAREYFERFYRSFPGHPLSSLLSERLRSAGSDLAKGQGEERTELRPATDSGSADNPEEGAASREGEFLVQVASFSSRENAEILAEDLGRSGFEASVHEARLDSGIVHRVVLDGFADRETAAATAARLKDKGYGTAIVEKQKQEPR